MPFDLAHALSMLGKHSTSELYPQILMFLKVMLCCMLVMYTKAYKVKIVCKT